MYILSIVGTYEQKKYNPNLIYDMLTLSLRNYSLKKKYNIYIYDLPIADPQHNMLLFCF